MPIYVYLFKRNAIRKVTYNDIKHHVTMNAEYLVLSMQNIVEGSLFSTKIIILPHVNPTLVGKLHFGTT